MRLSNLVSGVKGKMGVGLIGLSSLVFSVYLPNNNAIAEIVPKNYQEILYAEKNAEELTALQNSEAEKNPIAKYGLSLVVGKIMNAQDAMKITTLQNNEAEKQLNFSETK